MSHQLSKFEKALELHQAGSPKEAIDIYEKILRKNNDDAHLLFLLGTAYCQTGQAQKGIRHLKKSLDLCPNPIGYNNLGTALASINRNAEAIESFKNAITIDQYYAEAYCNLGVAYRNEGFYEDSLQSLDHAISIEKNYPAAYNNKGGTLHDLKRFDEAVECFTKAIGLFPSYVEALCHKGSSLKELKRYDEALKCLNRAISENPNYAQAYFNKGTIFQALDQLNEAVACYDKAITINQEYIDAYINKGTVLEKQIQIDQAIACYDKVISINPDMGDAHWNKALLLILKGQYTEGWKLFEWRTKKTDTRDHYRHFPAIDWRGQEDIRGKRLLIYAEQGFGDVIQFCRYLPQIAELGVEIIFEVPSELLSIASTLSCQMTLVEKGMPLPDFDAYCPIMSLPYALKTTVETIPAKVPYLHGDPLKVKKWQEKLGAKEKLRVGIVWSGSESNTKLLNRSIALEEFVSIIDLPIELHSLQKEYWQRDQLTLHNHPKIHQHQNDLTDFSDTAALMECMDLVITIDTSTAHLAAALGKPTWVMVRYESDYRWMLGIDDSPWYPTAKLFRQPELGDWDSVIQSVHKSLISLCNESSALC